MPVASPIGKTWNLLGVGPHGLILVTVVRGDWPEKLGLQSLGVSPAVASQYGPIDSRYVDETRWPEVRLL